MGSVCYMRIVDLSMKASLRKIKSMGMEKNIRMGY